MKAQAWRCTRSQEEKNEEEGEVLERGVVVLFLPSFLPGLP
jgi:hypothetical protein